MDQQPQDDLLPGTDISRNFLEVNVASIELTTPVSIEVSRLRTDHDVRVRAVIDLKNGQEPLRFETRLDSFLDLCERLKIDPEDVLWHHRPRNYEEDPLTYREQLLRDIEAMDEEARAHRRLS